CRFQREAAREDGEPLQTPPCCGLEQVVAPGDRAVERTLAGGQVTRSARQHVEALRETLQEGGRGKEANASRGELDRQGQSVEPAAESRHRRCVVGGER